MYVAPVTKVFHHVCSGVPSKGTTVSPWRFHKAQLRVIGHKPFEQATSVVTLSSTSRTRELPQFQCCSSNTKILRPDPTPCIITQPSLGGPKTTVLL